MSHCQSSFIEGGMKGLCRVLKGLLGFLSGALTMPHFSNAGRPTQSANIYVYICIYICIYIYIIHIYI